MNVCQTTIVEDAWARGQELSVHGWVYSLLDGRVRELGMDVDRAKQLQPPTQPRWRAWPRSADRGMSQVIHTGKAPKAVGHYPHARRVGTLLFLSGIGPRDAGDDSHSRQRA